MKRRTLDMVFVAGGVLLAVLLGVLGLVMKANADFAKDYVKDQLSQQQINFTAADALSPEEAASSCLVEYAGTPLDSGAKAECYANDYIALHMARVGDRSRLPGCDLRHPGWDHPGDPRRADRSDRGRQADRGDPGPPRRGDRTAGVDVQG